jgi:hypothetical protein
MSVEFLGKRVNRLNQAGSGNLSFGAALDAASVRLKAWYTPPATPDGRPLSRRYSLCLLTSPDANARCGASSPSVAPVPCMPAAR